MACGGRIGALSDGGTRRDPDSLSPDGSVCPQPSYGPVPPALPSCKVEERGCLTDTPTQKLCLPARLAVSVEPYLGACHVGICADIAVAFTGGCLTDVIFPTMLVDAGTLAELECVRKTLVGTHWSCAPSDGWFQFPLPSCTTH